MSEDKEPDIGLCWRVSPPLIVPLSTRARDILGLDNSIDCAIFIDAEPNEIFSAFPADTLIISMDDDYQPNLIASMTINKLH